jgi:hypothetical protein
MTGFMKASKLKALEQFAASFHADFRFSSINVMALITLCLTGLILHLCIFPFSLSVVITIVSVALALSLIIRISQIWEVVLIFTALAAVVTYLRHRPESWILVSFVTAAGIITPCIQIAYQWEKAVLLRFGKFRGLRGSGIFFLLPVVDKVANYVDQRIRVTDFRAETTLTMDTVPVNVDAIAFWMVWDAEKCVLDISFSSQTALRDSIGKHELGEMLSQRDKLGREIQKVLDDKTNAWGITVQSVEIKDIIIPKALEDAMSRKAQAERERQSRVILSQAENEVSNNFSLASEQYKTNPTALHLRAMNMILEGLKSKGSMIIVPSTAVETMGLGAMGGLTAFDRMLGSGGDLQTEKQPEEDEKQPK